MSRVFLLMTALPFEAYEFTSLEGLPVALRPTSPQYIEAWRALRLSTQRYCSMTD